jgi:hypothetical protein
MNATRGAGRAYWLCAGFTLFSAVVSAGFSLFALRMVGGHEYVLYAASRSVALPFAAVFAMATRSRGGVAAIAIAMTLIQLLDAIIGFRLNDLGRAYGPLILSAMNFGLLLWMKRATATQE